MFCYYVKNMIGEEKNLVYNIINKNEGLRILDIQEQDRQRIARELHDCSLQNLTHLIHKIELSSMYIDTDPNNAKLELALTNKVLRQTIDEIREIIFDLRPMTFDDLGFKAAIEKLVYRINENNKYKIVKDIDDVSCETNIILVSIYRNIQESINNIVKHAEAKEIIIKCKCFNNMYVVDIKDDGKGFDIDKNCDNEKHFGLTLINERVKLLNGIVRIESKINEGTAVHFEIPLERV